MIYQIGIGEYDNCYIITGGLTGFTSFEPVLVNGDSEACSIIIDKKDDSIFSPWIKQSLKVSLVKENETDYAEIIAGNDNETYGILIENGELGLMGTDITITSGGILKFIGTLALESYSEQYKEISIVSFTFNDRIGTLSDDDFASNSQYKPITDIIACCVNKTMCSGKCYLEWPYTLSGSDDPQKYLLDVTDLDEKTNLDVLEQVCLDHGLQLKVDFESNPHSKLVDCGAIRIVSIIEIAEQNNVFWELLLDSYVATACGIEYFTYTGSKNASLYKNRNLLNTIAIPLTDNETTLELDRVASSIIAKNSIGLIDSLIRKGVFDESLIISDGTLKYYCPILELNQSTAYNDIINIIDGADISDYDRVRCNNYGFMVYEFVYTIPPPTTYKKDRVATQVTFLDSTIFGINNKLELKVECTSKNPMLEPLTLHLNLIAKIGSSYKLYNGSNWIDFTTNDQLESYNDFIISSLSEETNSYNATIDNGGSDVSLMMVMVCRLAPESGIWHIDISELKVTVTKLEDLPSSITLTTDLSGNNRKDIKIDSVFLNSPDIPGAGVSIKNVIRDIHNNFPEWLVYKSLPQTLLAHLSDQYGWQYDGNRWNVNGTCKVVSGSMNLMGQFGLEDKVLTLISGEYNAKRKTLKGKWGQVLEVGVNKYRLLQDTFVPFTWDDGNYIMLN